MNFEEDNFLLDLTDFSVEMPPPEEGKPQENKVVDNPKEQKPVLEDDMMEIEDAPIKDKEEDDEDKIVEKSQPPETKATSSSSPQKHWVSFAKSLDEAGLLSFDETRFNELAEELGSPAEAVIAMADETIKGTIDAHIEQMDSDYQEFIRMRDAGVDMGKYGNISKQAKTYESFTLEDVKSDEDKQKQVVREDLKLKGMEREEIEDMIESLADTNKLEKRAVTALGNLNKFKEQSMKQLEEDAKRTDAERTASYQAQLKAIRTSVDEVSEIIPGLKINKQTKDKLFDIITKPVATINGQQVNALTAKMMENPTKFNMKLAELYRVGVFDDKWDSITKVTKSKAIEDLQKAVESGVDFKSRTSRDKPSILDDLKKYN
jgi:hypothetical protein